MDNLEKNKLTETLMKTRDKKIPLFGICLGLQLFFDSSEEFGTSKGLGLIKGNVKKLPKISLENQRLKIPNMGWFKVDLNNQFINDKFSKFVKSINENDLYYFVHSFFVDPIEKKNIAATYNFGGHKIPAIVSKDNFIGCQFHPEKSGKKGLEIISNFLKLLANSSLVPTPSVLDTIRGFLIFNGLRSNTDPKPPILLSLIHISEPTRPY